MVVGVVVMALFLEEVVLHFDFVHLTITITEQATVVTVDKVDGGITIITVMNMLT